MTNTATVETLAGVSETLLIPLYCKLLEHQNPHGLLKDEKIVEIVDRLKPNFDKFSTEEIWSAQVGVAVRTEILDNAVRSFLTQNSHPVIVNLGAGLCTRYWRVHSGFVRWFDIDLPTVKEVWQQVFTETSAHQYIGNDLLDFGWIQELKPLKDRPILFIAEGLFMYLDPTEVKQILIVIQHHFPQAELLIEAVSPFVAKRTNRYPQVAKTEAEFKWGITTGRTLEKWDENIQFLEEWYYLDYHRDRWRWMKWMKYVPPLRKAFKMIHLRFKPTK